MKSSYGSTCASQEVVFLSNYSNSDDDDDDNNIALIATLIICTKSDKKKNLVKYREITIARLLNMVRILI